jgi:tetratricopeptide (TPR) repeat protein
LPAIARESNVRYVLQGNVHVQGDEANVSVKLIDAQSAAQLWTGQFAADRPTWTGASQEAPLIVSRDLREPIWQAEERRVGLLRPQALLTPADLIVRVSILLRHRDPKHLAEARSLVDDALRQDPNYVLALRTRIGINIVTWENDPSADRVQLASESDELARRALAINRADPGVWRDRAWALGALWRWDAAFDALAEAHRLDPSHEADVVDRGWALSMIGKAEETIRITEEALTRNPGLDANPNFRHNQCYAQLLLGRFEQAVASCEKSAAGGDDWWPYFFLTVAYAQIGDTTKTVTSKAELLKRRPGFSISEHNALGLSNNPAYLMQAEANVLPGLRKAGIPEK